MDVFKVTIGVLLVLEDHGFVTFRKMLAQKLRLSHTKALSGTVETDNNTQGVE
jgi:hypothetical protein